MPWEERNVLAAPPQEKACKEVSSRGRAWKAILFSANGHLHQAWISLRALTVGFGASSNVDERNGVQS
jgi:hypothetical protein